MKLFKRKESIEKEESDQEIHERILKLCKEGDYGIIPPPLDTQVAVYELCRYFLGEDWYTAISAGAEQVNTIIVEEIESKYKGVRR